MAKNWIANAIKKPGALHKELGIKADKTIPAKTLAKALSCFDVVGMAHTGAEALRLQPAPAHAGHRRKQRRVRAAGLQETPRH